MSVPRVRRVIDGPTMWVELVVPSGGTLPLHRDDALDLSDLLLDAAREPDRCRGREHTCESYATEPDGLCPVCSARAEDLSDRIRGAWQK